MFDVLVSQAKWDKTPADYKVGDIADGTGKILMWDDGTVLAPVELIDSKVAAKLAAAGFPDAEIVKSSYVGSGNRSYSVDGALAFVGYRS